MLRIIEGSSDGLWDWDLETNAVFFNRQAYTLLDIPQQGNTLSFQTVVDRLLPEDRPSTKLAMQALLENSIPYAVAHRFMLADGSIRTCLCKGDITERSATGKPTKICGTITDITYLKKIEQTLQETKDRLDRVISGSDEGFWDWDVEQNTIYWSDRFFEMLGLEKTEGPVTYAFIETLLLEPDRERLRIANQEAIKTGQSLYHEVRMRHASGHYIYVYVKGKPNYNKTGQLIGFSGIVVDITRQKEHEQRLEESEARFRNLADSSPGMIWMTNAQRKVIYCNKAYTDVFSDKLMGSGWQDLIHPDDLGSVLTQIKNPGRQELEVRIRHKDGCYRWIYSISLPRMDKKGEFLGDMGISIDITQLKETQQKLSEYAAKLEQSNQELAQFVLVASHDLQEPLRKVTLFGGFLKEAAGESLPEECYDYINRLQNAISRMQTLIDDLLVLSRITRKARPFEATHLEQVVQDAQSELEQKIRDEQAIIEVSGTATVDADEVQIRQVLFHLLDNAIKFHKPDVPPVIQVKILPVDNQTTEIQVKDNGIGFDEKYLDRIFQIFERLHGRGTYSGSGIGLAIVKKIVERHLGTVTAQSQPGEGSTFIVRLPNHPEPA